MKKIIAILITLISISVFADGPVTNEDRGGDSVSSGSSGGNAVTSFLTRTSEKKHLAGFKVGPEVFHIAGWAGGGGHFDFFYEYNFTNNLGIQTELNFIGGRGWGFFRLPVMVQGNAKISDLLWLNYGGGLYIATSWWGGFDLGLIAKVALEINTKVGVFIVDTRYLPSIYGSATAETFMGSWALLLGYAVPF
ncbi:MAG: hypothetical protein ACOX2F_07705 [bacterium]